MCHVFIYLNVIPWVHPDHLGDEDGGHGLVECGAIHVNGGADGEDEPGDPGLLQVLRLLPWVAC